jgi:hypothetical protein
LNFKKCHGFSRGYLLSLLVENLVAVKMPRATLVYPGSITTYGKVLTLDNDNATATTLLRELIIEPYLPKKEEG